VQASPRPVSAPSCLDRCGIGAPASRATARWPSVTPILGRVRIDDFRAAGSTTWQHVHDYIVGYLSDTLSKVPRAEGLPSYRTYQGHGVTVGFTYTPPSAPSGKPAIDLVVIRDEPPAQTIGRAFGVELPVASSLDRNWSDVATTLETHVQTAAVADEVWMRTNANYTATQSDASRCASWVRSWLRLWESYEEGAMRIPSVEGRTLARAESATRHPVRSASVVTIEVGGERRRDQFEVHMPISLVGIVCSLSQPPSAPRRAPTGPRPRPRIPRSPLRQEQSSDDQASILRTI